MASTDARAFYVIGLGAVGLGMARALAEAGWHLVGASNRGALRRDSAKTALGIEVAAEPGPEMAAADLILVCVSDDAIPRIGAALAASGRVRAGCVVCHTAGLLSGAALGELPGAHTASLHPLVAVPTGLGAGAALQAAPYAIEGDPRALPLLSEIVEALAGRPFAVSAADKPRYHAAAVMASNLVVTLLGDAIDVAGAAGIEPATALLTELAAGAITSVAEIGATQALTGPVVRGDIESVRRHLQALGPEARSTYVAVSLAALRRARRRGLDAEVAGKLEALLTGPN